MRETTILGLSSPNERFKERAGKRISSWLSIRHDKGSSRRTIVITYCGMRVPLSLDAAKRLRQWLDGVIP